MIQIGTELKAPANAKEGQSWNVRKDPVFIEGQTIHCKVEAREYGLVLVVVDITPDIPLQQTENKAYLVYDAFKS